jgi:hypothetical protein
MFRVSLLISEKIGTWPEYRMEFEEATKEIGEVIILEFFGKSKVCTAICSPAVALEVATANLAPTNFATAVSKSRILEPWVRE